MGKFAARFALLAVAISIVIVHCEAGKKSFDAYMKKHTLYLQLLHKFET